MPQVQLLSSLSEVGAAAAWPQARVAAGCEGGIQQQAGGIHLCRPRTHPPHQGRPQDGGDQLPLRAQEAEG